MIEEAGRVIAVETDAVWVETLRQESCQACSSRATCGHHLLSASHKGARAQVRALCHLGNISVGDSVRVGIPEKALMHAALRVYLLPLLLLYAGALAGFFVAGNDASALLGITGLVAGFLLNRRHDRQHGQDQQFLPRVLSVSRALKRD